jgi:hypothetical protein
MDMPDIDKIMKRTARHLYEDGIGEIFYGVAFLLIGLLAFVEAAVKPPIPSFSAIGLIVVVLGAYLLGRWLVPALRRRLVFPRTGFVAHRQLSVRRRWMALGIAALAGCVLGGVGSFAHAIHPAWSDWVPLGDGLVVGAFLLVIGSGVGLRRFQVLAGFSGLAGLAALVAGLGEPLASAAYWAAMGLALMVSGALALWAYLHRAPQPEEQ